MRERERAGGLEGGSEDITPKNRERTEIMKMKLT